MGRLKRDHGGWHTSGLWLKYQQPTAKELPLKNRAKKDTNKWCRGKVGVEHELHQRIHLRFNSSTWYKTWCKNCRKELHKKRVKSLPLHVEVKQGASSRAFPIQVKVNGKAIPIDSRLYEDNSYYCEQCEQWHY